MVAQPDDVANIFCRDSLRWPELTTLPGAKLDARSAPVGQKPRMASVSLHAHRQSVLEHFPDQMIFINLYMKLNLERWPEAQYPQR